MTQTIIELRNALEELTPYLPAHYSAMVVDRLPDYTRNYVRRVKCGDVHNQHILLELIKLAREQRDLAQTAAQ